MTTAPLFRRDRYDVIIIGARCAGASLAMLLTRAGLSVLAIDRESPGADTLSTHALMRPAVQQLSRWGLLDRIVTAGTPVGTETTFHYGKDIVTVPVRAEPGMPGLISPRRWLLDRVLVDAAAEAGAEVVHNTSVVELLRDPGRRIEGVLARHLDGRTAEIRAGLVVGADGARSSVAKWVGAAVRHRGTAVTACIYGYAELEALAGNHWYFDIDAAAGVIPTNEGLACCFVSVPQSTFESRFRRDLASSHAALMRRFRPDAEPEFRGIRAFAGMPAIVRQAHGLNWLLVGDAGLFRDPLTSHGISDAFRDAEGAAHAIIGGTSYDMHLFEEERDALAWPMLEATERICAFDWDFDDLRGQHKALSAAMKTECLAIATRPLPGAVRNSHSA